MNGKHGDISFVTHLECAQCGREHEAHQVQSVCRSCQKPLWVRYDLAALKKAFPKRELAGRPPTLWRYLELLPVTDPAKIVSLVETITPVLPARRLASALGVNQLWIKDESRLPTGSFKARGMALAITKANEFGLRRVAAPTAGNAGGALAAYAARAGMESWVFMPDDTPVINPKECILAGARAYRVPGLIHECGRWVREGAAAKGWFDVSTLREPYRIEGKKTMGLELAEQFDWDLPEVILYPTGGGTGLIGMGKAFQEMEAIGWLPARGRKPRLVVCQSDGCAPMVRAFDQGQRVATFWESAATMATGLRVPAALGDFMILDAVRASGGTALATPESEIYGWMKRAASTEGIALCPEAAVCLGALDQLLQRGWIQSHERVLLFNTAAAQKYPEAIAESPTGVPAQAPPDWDRI